jgi:hypothetical protein
MLDVFGRSEMWKGPVNPVDLPPPWPIEVRNVRRCPDVKMPPLSDPPLLDLLLGDEEMVGVFFEGLD